MYETLLFDGTDIKVPGVRSIEVWDDVLSTPSLRGDDQELPLLDGAVDVDDRPFPATMVGLGLVLTSTGRTVFNDVFRTLRRLVKVDGTVELTRRLSYSTGNEDHTCTARYASGLDPKLTSAMADGRLVLVMKNLLGLWYGPAVSIADGVHDVLGDVRTRRTIVTFTGGADPTLTNTMTGDVLSWAGAPGAGVDIDVLNMTATQGGVDVSSTLTWSRTYPLTLRAGSNSLVLTGGGAVDVAYRPAYL